MAHITPQTVIPATRAMLLGIFLCAMPVQPAQAELELLMIDSDDCPYCRKFDREIASIYPKTPEGKRAPLVRISIDAEWPEKYRSISPGDITPQFILVENGREVDRLLGYNGDEFFWFLLDELFAKLDTKGNDQ